MSVSVKRPRPYSSCDSCNGEKHIVEVCARTGQGSRTYGISISLCRRCAAKLAEKLDQHLTGTSK